MPSLSNGKVLGGVGGILALLPLLSVVGWILITIAMMEISDHTQDKKIREDGLVGGITAVISSILLLVSFFTNFFGLVGIPLGIPSTLTPDELLTALAVFGAFCLFTIISGIFLKRAYDRTAQQLKIGHFATAGLLYLIGGITSILLVGFLMLFIAFIFQIVAYFSIQEPHPPVYYGFQTTQPPQVPMPITPQITQPPQPTPPSIVQPPQNVQPQVAQSPPVLPSGPTSKFCFMCGTKLPFNAVYCTSCGTRQS